MFRSVTRLIALFCGARRRRTRLRGTSRPRWSHSAHCGECDRPSMASWLQPERAQRLPQVRQQHHCRRQQVGEVRSSTRIIISRRAAALQLIGNRLEHATRAFCARGLQPRARAAEHTTFADICRRFCAPPHSSSCGCGTRDGMRRASTVVGVRVVRIVLS